MILAPQNWGYKKPQFMRFTSLKNPVMRANRIRRFINQSSFTKEGKNAKNFNDGLASIHKG